jgi:hypothetical protein
MTRGAFMYNSKKQQQKTMTNPDPDSSSNFALEEKNQKMTTNQYGPPPFLKIK